MSPRLVFAGGGHAHLHPLKRTADLVASGHEVVLVDPSPHLFYSGMATGVISGAYSPREHRLDIRRLVLAGGGKYIEGAVERVVPKERVLLLSEGGEVPYDAVSFCLGSETKDAGLDAKSVPYLPVKPVENLLKLREAILNGEASNLLIVGGGPAGCEVAANAAVLTKEGSITLVEAGPEILPFAPKRARRRMADHLRSVGVTVLPSRKPAFFEPGFAALDDGRKLPADLVVAATGVSPPEVFARSGLLTADDGAMWVDHYLRSPGDGRIFGGGDSVSFRGGPLPRFGVYAVRQGPVLFHNLRAALAGEPLRPFEPQKAFLYILNLGNGTGLAVYGPLVWQGRSAMRLKDCIDRKFVNSFQRSAVSPGQDDPH